MKTSAIKIRKYFSKLLRFPTQLDTAVTPSEINAPKMITGKPVPSAKAGGNRMPAEAVSAIGIRTMKNSTALYGQNAIPKNTPIRKAPPSPQSDTLFPNAAMRPPLPKEIRSANSMSMPAMISTGPMTYVPTS